MPVHVEHDGVAAALPAGQRDDLAAAQVAEDAAGAVAVRGGPGLGELLLPRADRLLDPGVLEQVAALAGDRRAVVLDGVLELAGAPGEPHHGAVRLELGEAGLEGLAGAGEVEAVQQVHRHVRGGPEGGAQRVGAARGEGGGGRGVEARPADDHGMSLGVDAAPSRTSRELGVLPRCEVGVLDAVELHELLEHHGAGRHVDAEGEGLGGEDDLEQPAGEELLDDGLQQRQHPGVVGGVAVQDGAAEGVQAQHLLVLDADLGQALVEDGADLAPLVVVGQAQPGPGALLDGALAAGAGEDEHDRGQQRGVVEQLDHLGAAHRTATGSAARAAVPTAVVPRAVTSRARTVVARALVLAAPVPAPLAARRAVASGAAGAVAAAGALPAAMAAAALSSAALVHRQGEGADPLDLGVDLTIAAGAGAVGDDGLPVGVDEEVQQLLADDHVLPQRHRPRLGDDDRGLAPHLLEPGPELLGVRDRRRERDQLDGAVQVDDDLFPHGPAQAIGEVVHLVHHHEAQPVQQVGVRVEHVAQHLGGHHDHLRGGADRGVARQQADALRAQPVRELAELLVRQRLDRRGVEDLPALREREMHRELADDGLAGAGRGGHQHGAAVLEGAAAGELEVVQREVVAGGEGGELGVLPPLLLGPGGVLLGRRGHRAPPSTALSPRSAERSASRRTAPGSTRAVRGSRERASPSA